jgi:hypothetical protein
MSALRRVERPVYFAPTKGRHYLTARGAAVAEANALLAKKYPTEKPEYENGMCYYDGYHWSSEERLLKVHKRVMRILLRNLRRSA